MVSTAKKLWSLFSQREKKQFLILMGLTLFSSFLEVIGIGAVIPLMMLLISPDSPSTYYQNLSHFINPIPHSFTQGEKCICFGGILVFIFIVKNSFLFFLDFLKTKFAIGHAASVSMRLFEKYINSSYVYHLHQNSAKLLRNINDEINVYSAHIMVPFMVVTTVSFILLAICAFLFYFSFWVTVCMITMIGFFSVFFKFISKSKMQKYGDSRQEAVAILNQTLMQSLGGIKETKILQREDFFIKKFNQVAKQHANARAYSVIANASPKYFIETLAIIVILSITIGMLSFGVSPHTVLIQLSVLGVAALRMLPSLSQLMSSTSLITFGTPALNLIYNELRNDNNIFSTTNIQENPASFNNLIRFENISFCYPKTDREILSNISLAIKKGESIGIIGMTGAGKTTFVDLLLGLLEPTKGNIFADSVDIQNTLSSWQKKFSYIPQNLYLADESIKHNVAFGIENNLIDEQLIFNALKLAQLDEFVFNLPDGINTCIGERGVRLSGGQRQRICIARALYNKPEILIMDEATASLDYETEHAVVKAIDEFKGKITTIVIAHRLSTVKNCDRIFKFENAGVSEVHNSAYSVH